VLTATWVHHGGCDDLIRVENLSRHHVGGVTALMTRAGLEGPSRHTGTQNVPHFRSIQDTVPPTLHVVPSGSPHQGDTGVFRGRCPGRPLVTVDGHRVCDLPIRAYVYDPPEKAAATISAFKD